MNSEKNNKRSQEIPGMFEGPDKTRINPPKLTHPGWNGISAFLQYN